MGQKVDLDVRDADASHANTSSSFENEREVTATKQNDISN